MLATADYTYRGGQADATHPIAGVLCRLGTPQQAANGEPWMIDLIRYLPGLDQVTTCFCQ